MAAALVVVLLLLAALAWLIFGGGDDPDTGPGAPNPGIDRDELAEAEADVRDAPDPESVRDWGPGAPKDQSH
ncbi:MAG TPA: hypothetical protein VH113_07185 [Gemmatimonadales bacterium]|jgi:hypothetical protein|nr:hypothetical protein [Gemmatimonadales bacterium]